MGLIYMYRNKLNNMKYIGQTVNSLEHRLSAHLSNTVYSCSYIDRALQKYGKDNFEFSILEDNIPNDLLNDKEIYYIKKYNTFNNGYNLTLGGSGALKYDSETIDKIRYDLSNTKLSMCEISSKYGVSYDYVCDINYGGARHIDGVDYPIRKVPSNQLFSNDVASDVANLLKNTNYSMSKIADITYTNLYFVFDVNRGRRRVSGITFPIRPNKLVRVEMTPELAVLIIKELQKHECSNHQIAIKFNVYDWTVGSINRGEHSICKLLDDYTFPIRKREYRSENNKNRKIYKEDLIGILDLLINTKLSFEEIARRYDVSKSSIQSINAGTTFKSVTSKYKLPIRQNNQINKDVQL